MSLFDVFCEKKANPQANFMLSTGDYLSPFQEISPHHHIQNHHQHEANSETDSAKVGMFAR